MVKDKADNLQKGPFKAMMSVYDEDSFRKVEARRKIADGLVANPSQITTWDTSWIITRSCGKYIWCFLQLESTSAFSSLGSMTGSSVSCVYRCLSHSFPHFRKYLIIFTGGKVESFTESDQSSRASWLRLWSSWFGFWVSPWIKSISVWVYKLDPDPWSHRDSLSLSLVNDRFVSLEFESEVIDCIQRVHMVHRLVKIFQVLK